MQGKHHRAAARLFSNSFTFPPSASLDVANVIGHHSYGTAKSGVGISAMSVLRPDLMMKCVVPVIMAGIIAVSMITLENAFSQVMELTHISSL